MEGQNIPVTKKEKSSKKRLKAFFKTFIRIFSKIVLFLSLPVFLIVPFLSRVMDHTLAQWLWYPALIISLIWGFYSPNEKVEKETKIEKIFGKKGSGIIGNISFLWLVLLFAVVFIINYYSLLNWFWFVFIIFLPMPLLGCVGMYFYSKKQGLLDFENQFPFFRKSLYWIFFYWLIDFFYMTLFIEEQIPMYILGGLTLILILYSLVMSFLSPIQQPLVNKIRKYGLIQDFVIGIGLTVYLLWTIENKELQQILTTVIAAVYGGLLTLVGVAWTIRQGQKERAEDRKQLEEDRKQEEIKKAKPILSFLDLKSNANEPILTCTFIGLPCVDRPETVSMKARFMNSDNSNFKVAAFEIDGKKYPAEYTFYIVKNQFFNVRFNASEHNQKYVLVLEDILGNQYSYQMIIKPCSKNRITGELTFQLISFSEITEDAP
ncbi:MAG: hypothetical protein J5885_05115 [Clostridia bacterium]|nr:hypothetical protein [Clostridia bacterium]